MVINHLLTGMIMDDHPSNDTGSSYTLGLHNTSHVLKKLFIVTSVKQIIVFQEAC